MGIRLNIRHDLKIAYADEYLKLVEENIKSDPRSIFNYKKLKSGNSLGKMRLGDKLLSHESEVAQPLADRFCSSYSNAKSFYDCDDIS